MNPTIPRALADAIDACLCNAFRAGQADTSTSPDHPASYDHDAVGRAATSEAEMWEALADYCGQQEPAPPDAMWLAAASLARPGTYYNVER